MRVLNGIVIVWCALVLVPVDAAADVTAAVRTDWIPAGTLNFDTEGTTLDFSSSTEVAFGLAGEVGYAFSPKYAMAVAPRVVFGIKGDADDDSITELDVMVRGMPMYPLANGTTFYSYGALGYSRLFLPAPADNFAPSGLVVGFGGGFRFPVRPGVSLGLELGYQLGFQGGEEMGVEYEFSTRLLHVGVVVGTAP
jgi:hypothetical protein